MSETVDLKQVVEGDEGISVIRGSGTCRGWNNIQYKAGLSAKNVNARKLSMNVATIPPGGVAYAHIHVDFEVMLYILQGRVRHEYGPGLKKSVENEAGDFIFITRSSTSATPSPWWRWSPARTPPSGRTSSTTTATARADPPGDCSPGGPRPFAIPPIDLLQ
jgi:uncharacterized RmlC-like cupin family protein